MATLVDILDIEEQVAEFIQHFKKLKDVINPEQIEQNGKLVQELTQFVKVENYALFFAKLLPELSTLFSPTNDVEVESGFNVFITLLRKQDVKELRATVNTIIQFITSSTTDRSVIRLKILTNLYNLLNEAPIPRFELFLHVLNYAVASKNIDLIFDQLKKVEDWLKEWKASKEQIRETYKILHNIYHITDRGQLAYNYLIKFLSTYDAPAIEVRQEAAHAAIETIKTPEIFQSDHLLELPVIKQLETDTNYSKLYQLLKIFAVDNVDAFNAFISQNPGFLESTGLPADECNRKIRLLSLATLASQHTEIPYALIAERLKISNDEIEHWIVDAIGADLLDAKIDQLRQVLIVSRCTQRVFGTAQWQQLRTNLSSWAFNLNQVLAVIKNSTAKVDHEGLRD